MGTQPSIVAALELYSRATGDLATGTEAPRFAEARESYRRARESLRRATVALGRDLRHDGIDFVEAFVQLRDQLGQCIPMADAAVLAWDSTSEAYGRVIPPPIVS